MTYKSPKQIDTEQKERIKELEKCLRDLFAVSFTESESRLSLIAGSGVTNISDDLQNRCTEIGVVRQRAQELLTNQN